MKTNVAGLSLFALLMGTTADALAATGREDSSGIFVWVFLGFCALIVVAQLVPAVMVLLGFAKGVSEISIEEKEKAEETASK